MNHPQNYQELHEQALRQVYLKELELEERAENMRKLRAALEAAPHVDPGIAIGQIDDYEDSLNLDKLQEIIRDWPHVDTAPGEGYW